ncbi:hypothetical protein EIP91_001878 [Steccherinum ochraceum]|uniref:SigF-like NTF2-like domain-containing protein n=1 Tax=Steccherinum ochraceum TaxID=92696 RepID=A0A4R0RLQ1_9APHY|nr:hypothetical protein EIP91_001878 [Steccherinum ochraceum]
MPDADAAAKAEAKKTSDAASAKKYRGTTKGKETGAAYEASDEGKARQAAYDGSDKGKARSATYGDSEKGKARNDKYEATDGAKAKARERQARFKAKKAEKAAAEKAAAAAPQDPGAGPAPSRGFTPEEEARTRGTSPPENMEHPEEEIADVVKTLTCAESPEAQKAAVEKYYAVDAAFRHPLSTVVPGPNSRSAILGVYQWYRVLSPTIQLNVDSITYNSSRAELFLEVTQSFHIRWSPFSPAPARLLVHLVLSPSIDDPKLWVISLQEDFYHPEDLTALVVPPLMPLTRLLLRAGSMASNVNAFVFGKLGYWAVKEKEKPARPSVASTAS